MHTEIYFTQIFISVVVTSLALFHGVARANALQFIYLITRQ